MDKEFKRNCNSCISGLFSSCDALKNNKEYQSIKEEDIFDTKKFEFKDQFICDEYKSIYIEYPIEVSKINNKCKKSSYKDNKVGKFVKIRPCHDEYKNKTYLGLYLGDMPIGSNISYNEKSKELDISFKTNPAIFVFDLNKIIYGCESWWGIIKKEEDLKQITDADINNIWYVKALNSIKN